MSPKGSAVGPKELIGKAALFESGFLFVVVNGRELVRNLHVKMGMLETVFFLCGDVVRAIEILNLVVQKLPGVCATVNGWFQAR